MLSFVPNLMRPVIPAAAESLAPPTPGRRWLRADLHLHTAEDPCDVVDPGAAELLEVAAARGFHVLAVTLHGTVLDRPELAARARELGILLVPAAELRVDGADVVVLNLTAEEAAATRTFADLRRLREHRGESLFVFAPHPFYPGGCCLGRTRLEANRDCFDAVELCHLPVPLPPAWNPNAAAARFARRHGLPLVATSDAHYAGGFGAHFSLVGVAAEGDDSPTDAAALFRALRAGHVRPVRLAGGAAFRHLLTVLWFLFVRHPWRKFRRWWGIRRGTDAGEISFCPSPPAP